MSELLPHRKPIPETTLKQWKRLNVGSRLEAARRHRGLRQEDMAPALGVSLSTYRRLENLQLAEPSIRLLSNCAILLDVPLTSLIEDEWCEWAQLSKRGNERVPKVRWHAQIDTPELPPD